MQMRPCLNDDSQREKLCAPSSLVVPAALRLELLALTKHNTRAWDTGARLYERLLCARERL